MQPTPPVPPTPPAPPAPVLADPAAPTVVVTDGGATAGVIAPRALPRTAQDIAGLRNQRDELSNQLVSAQSRRKDVARALERADNPANRAGLEQRLGVLDRRIAQIESDIAETGRLITTASPALVAQADRRDGPFNDGPPGGAVAIVFILFVLFPLVLTFARGMRRRGLAARPEPVDRESAARLARVEQAVDAIAVEVERVSEGQRFVTRLLAESRGMRAVGAPAAAPPDTLDAVSRYPG